MHYQSTTALAAFILLCPTTFAAVMKPYNPLNPGVKATCTPVLNAAAHKCGMVACSATGEVMLQGAPDDCMEFCHCDKPTAPNRLPMDGGKPAADSVPGTGPAPVVENNPRGVTYSATLPDSEKSGIRGTVIGSSALDGTGVNFKISLSGLPDASLGPFSYHIHDKPVPEDGNCTKTMAHLDPYHRGQMPACDPMHPETCEVGDLSGKHGKIGVKKMEHRMDGGSNDMMTEQHSSGFQAA
ncbi:MAG: hypothetical protein Q9168_008047 [Polycauliona sp. 1 TL-2023]